jgi:hypothetical protein
LAYYRKSLGLLFQKFSGYVVRLIEMLRRSTIQVPKLTVSRSCSQARPTAWFICPDHESPSGGIRKLYQSVDILNAAGLNAAIMHTRPGFRCTWFENNTHVVNTRQAVIYSKDVIVVPEIYGGSIRDLPKNIRQVIFNQNVYLTLRSLAESPANAAAYIDNPDLALVLVVSEDSANVIEYAFPRTPIRRIRLGLDPDLHHPSMDRKRRRIAYMPRKRACDAKLVLELLRNRNVLDDWELIAIEQRSEAEAAELLRSAQIFLSFNRQEGFGLPPLEALACGCLVVGYTGYGGREYFRPPFAIAVEDGDVVAFAQKAEELIRRVDTDPYDVTAAAVAGSRFALDYYSRDAEREALLDVFVPLLGGASESANSAMSG